LRLSLNLQDTVEREKVKRATEGPLKALLLLLEPVS
jgi:hypothetical protein